jgi:Fe2+ or Zn2+ uptake regulation protein
MATGNDSLREPQPIPVNLRKSLENGGLRFTRQRLAVYEYLSSVESHPTAEEICAAIRSRLPRISLATVYNALDALVACQLANKLTFTDGPARYDCDRGEHYHLRDLRTGQVCDLPTRYDPGLIDKLDPRLGEYLKARGFEVTGYRLEVLGHFKED